MRRKAPISVVAAAIALVTATALMVAGCGSTEGTPEAAASSTAAAPSTASESETTVASSPPPQSDTRTSASTAATTTKIPTSGPCLDVGSPLVTDAISTLGTDVNGGNWIPTSSSEEQVGNCPDLLWVSVDGDGVGDATYQTHVLFFRDGTYLGTATSKPYSYTHVIDSNKGSVSVQYRWLLDDDAFCCPQGGPNIVNFTWNGSAVVADGQFPPS
ncbi:LppP/LprE family lipoprotein [Rhodococcus sp. IEGM 1409]|uniref:LppP/LprE family lipoprotein n=1 Tax=Rhodococcus sp. IEGM 1409 TaxID=3047082 RepID=UPI0024B6BBF2|nr:LppP/LprE family lipoprotein [Rhodococcus sp. IEGM 1409]MDI9898968.1 LppP/LprE family lipoprotein [Rhodococcus sp. IEGM 1409]